MKKFLSLIVLSSIFFISCSSDDDGGARGPQGPPGEDGLDGLGYTYERTIDLEYLADLNLYSQVVRIPDDVATFEPESDAVFVYRLALLEAENGGTIDSWSLIPQNFFTDDGTFQYVYNHTVRDVEILIDGNYDLSNLSSQYIDNQTFRIVVLPSAAFEANADIDFSNFGEVQKRFEMDIK